MKNSNDTIWDRTSDLPICSTALGIKYSTVKQATDVDVMRRMLISCWITKATDTILEYIIIIFFPRQQWLRKRSSVLLCTYITHGLHRYSQICKQKHKDYYILVYTPPSPPTTFNSVKLIQRPQLVTCGRTKGHGKY